MMVPQASGHATLLASIVLLLVVAEGVDETVHVSPRPHQLMEACADASPRPDPPPFHKRRSLTYVYRTIATDKFYLEKER